MEIKGYTLVNEDKVERALHGSPTANGSVGGIAKADGSFDEDLLLAEYDKLGGLITRGNDKVKTGSFYDFKAKQVRKEPKVVFVYFVNGKFVEVNDGAELPGVVKAAKILAEEEVAPIQEEATEEKKAVRRRNK